MYRWFVRFQNMDRRWIFLGMAIAILLPMLSPSSASFSVDRPVRDIYERVESLPPGSTVYISADFDPGSRPELEPFYRAIIHQLFGRDIKIVAGTLWASAPPLVLPILREVAESHGKVYGTDWCFLGFKDGKELAIKAIGENIPKTFPTDFQQTPIEELPVAAGFKQLKDFNLLILVSAGFPGIKAYVLQVQGQYDLKMVGATTAVSGPDYIPYYKAGQLLGLSAGMPGSAQYEKLVFLDAETCSGFEETFLNSESCARAGHTWIKREPKIMPERLLGIEALSVLNLGHLFIVALIILGNLAFFITRPKGVE